MVMLDGYNLYIGSHCEKVSGCKYYAFLGVK
jgi:hypothetical protein